MLIDEEGGVQLSLWGVPLLLSHSNIHESSAPRLSVGSGWVRGPAAAFRSVFACPDPPTDTFQGVDPPLVLSQDTTGTNVPED